MKLQFVITILFSALLLPAADMSAATAAPLPEQDAMITIWPLVDYRENRLTKSSRLSLLGPLLSFDKQSDETISALRPLFHTTNDRHSPSSYSYYLYPLASSETTPDVSRMQLLQLFQKNTFRKAEPAETEHEFMLFPLIISGESKQHGPYTSIFPLYGDLYGRFYRDEHHYVLFPLYSRTVNKGTTNYNFLWPFFSVTRGENESGFQLWPLYGQASKEGSYNSRFALWPIYSAEERGLNSDNPTHRFTLFPLYSAFDSATVTSRTFLWPFFGYWSDRKENEEGRDYLWPFWLTVSGEKRNIFRLLPFYSDERAPDSTKNWYLWPFFRTDTMQSSLYRQESLSVLFFLFSDRVESWAVDDKSRRRTALWPLFVYSRDVDDSMSLTLPALIEPVLDRDGIEKVWAPLWRVYVQKWNSHGDSSLSLFWNLYWHDRSKDSRGWELFPLVRQRSAPSFFELQILKGLINYSENGSRNRLSILWLPFGIDWQSAAAVKESKP